MQTPQVAVDVPRVRLPKGGGAIKGIGETFQPSPFTGTGSFAIPLTVPVARGLEPDLQLTYSSAGAQGVFGVGFNLSVPHIVRRTEKRLPNYSSLDEFVFSDAEYLVPMLHHHNGDWEMHEESRDALEPEGRVAYRIQQYRPRTEGAFLRIERWTRTHDGDDYWRITTSDGITSTYGRSPTARIVHPDHPQRIFSWLLEETEDDRGNRIQYVYQREDGVGIAPRLSERDRLQTTQTYLHKIQYGNKPDGSWAFSVVLDYGEYDLEQLETLTTAPTRTWSQRLDPFSDYRAGFEVRTHRLCRNILIFHHFPQELGVSDCLERSIQLHYQESPVLSRLASVQFVGYRRRQMGGYEQQPLPPLTFQYSDFDATAHHFEPLLREGEQPLVNQFDTVGGYQLLDLYGEGIAGLLYDHNGITLYWSAEGNGYGAPQVPAAFPVERHQPSPAYALSDGLYTQATIRTPGRSGTYQRMDKETWEGFQPFVKSPIDYGNPAAEYIDVTGDGRADLLLFDEEQVKVYPGAGRAGHEAAIVATRAAELPFTDSPTAAEKLLFADMGGDGLSDRVRIRNGEVTYWPNLGYGRFGPKVTMTAAPHFGEAMDEARIFLVDIDGSGTSDLVYVDGPSIWVYYNQSGNGFSPPERIPLPDHYSALSQIQFADIQGNGTTCLVFRAGEVDGQQQYYDFTGGVKPHLLTEIDNHMGAISRIYYAPSTYFYLADRRANRPWLTQLPFPVQLVERVEQVDLVARSRRVSRFAYHHGAFEFREREFAGFGLVEQWDTETFEKFQQTGTDAPAIDLTTADLHVPPVYTKTWYHTGIAEQEPLSQQFAAEYYTQQALLEDSRFETPLAEPASLQAAHRALRGRLLRREVYGLDGTTAEPHPYTVEERNYTLRLIQPAEGTPASVYLPLPREAITYHYERHPVDPRIVHQLYLHHDRYGKLTHRADLAYARDTTPEHPDQAGSQGIYTVEDYLHLTEPAYKLGIPTQSQQFELTELPTTRMTWEQLHQIYPQPELTAVDFDQTPVGTGARLLSWQRYRYWNDDQTIALPWGQSGQRALLHHTETAMYPQGGIEQLLQPTGAPNMAEKLLSRDADGGAWITVQRAVGGRQYYVDPGTQAVYGGAERFYQAEQYSDQFGTVTQVGYDPYRLLLVRTEAHLSAQQHLVHTVEPDYHTLQPARDRDINYNVTEYLYDPLGNLRLVSRYGQEGDGQRGDRPLSAYQMPATWKRERLLAEPHAYLQNATRCFFYDVMAWERQRQPVHTLSIEREIYFSEQGNLRQSPLQMSLEYFDGLGRSVQQKQRAEAGLAVDLNDTGQVVEKQVQERWITTGWSIYNNKGLVVKQFEPFYATTAAYQAEPALTYHGVATIRHYDPLGRVRRLDLPKGYVTRTEYGAWDERRYDANDALPESPYYQQRSPAEQQQLNARFGDYFGTFTRQGFDGWGRPILQQERLAAEGDPLTTSTWLDWLGNPLQMQDPRLRQRDLVNVRILYDMEGRLLKLEGVDQGTHWRLYNAGGDEIQRWDSRGFRISTDYDALSRLIAVWVENAERRYQAERLEYGETVDPAGDRNLRGRLINRYDQAGVTQFSRYTLEGNWRTSQRRFCRDYQTAPDWSQNPTLEAELFKTQRFFDALGRLLLLRLPDQRVVRQLYHASGRVRSLQYREDQQYQPVVNDIRYNARDQKTQVTYGSGVSTTYEYDPQTFYLTQLRSQRQRDDQTLQDIRYDYDPVGNLTAISDRSHHTIFGQNDRVEPRQTYRYDALYRLTQATGREHPGLHRAPRRHGLINDAAFLPIAPNRNNAQALQNYRRNYTYDTAGNLTQIQHVGPGTAFTRNMLISDTSNRGILQPDNALNTDPEQAYDPNGNLITLAPSRRMEMRWNYRNQLLAVDVVRRAGGVNDSEYYVYDGAGQRARKVCERLVNGQVEIEETLYLGAYEVYRVRRGDQVRRERTSTHLTLAQDKVATVYRWTVRQQNDPNRQVRYRLGNHQDSVALELDETGNRVTYEEYYPYGGTALIASQGDREVKRKVYRYGGRERDAISQFYHYGERYYVPWLGRWLSPDPAGLVDGLNLYQFVHGNPITHVDDMGNKTFSAKKLSTGTQSSGSSSGSSSSLSSPVVNGNKFLNVGRRKQRPRLPQAWLNAPPSQPNTSSPSKLASSLSSSSSSSSSQSSDSASTPRLRAKRASNRRPIAPAIASQRSAVTNAANGGPGSPQSASPAGNGAASGTQKQKIDVGGDLATGTDIATKILAAIAFLNYVKAQGLLPAGNQPANRSDSTSTRSQGSTSSAPSQTSDDSSSSSSDMSSRSDSDSRSSATSSTSASSTSSDEDDSSLASSSASEDSSSEEESSTASSSSDDTLDDSATASSDTATSQNSLQNSLSSGSASGTQTENRQRQ
ncbi:MAG: SpvB/TcaC N-terminal domain-containing protein [Cyanobacteria bacterium P01_H01_bin.162]